jgi:hypothetical protein
MSGAFGRPGFEYASQSELSELFNATKRELEVRSPLVHEAGDVVVGLHDDGLEIVDGWEGPYHTMKFTTVAIGLVLPHVKESLELSPAANGKVDIDYILPYYAAIDGEPQWRPSECRYSVEKHPDSGFRMTTTHIDKVEEDKWTALVSKDSLLLSNLQPRDATLGEKMKHMLRGYAVEEELGLHLPTVAECAAFGEIMVNIDEIITVMQREDS